MVLEIVHSKSAANQGTFGAKSANFQGLVFVPNTEKLLLWDLKWTGKTQMNV